MELGPAAVQRRETEEGAEQTEVELQVGASVLMMVRGGAGGGRRTRRTSKR